MANEAEEKGWFRKKLMFQSSSSRDLLYFPEMTEKDLKILFTGSYQLSQAVSYLAKMMNDNEFINLQFVKEQANILKIQVQSKHISRKLYRRFIGYRPSLNAKNAILHINIARTSYQLHMLKFRAIIKLTSANSNSLISFTV